MVHSSPSDDEDINKRIRALKKQRNAGRRQRASAWLHKPVTYAQNGYHRMFPPKSDVTNVRINDNKNSKGNKTFAGLLIAFVLIAALVIGIVVNNANIDRLSSEKAAAQVSEVAKQRDDAKTQLQAIKDDQAKSQAQIDQLKKDVEAAKKQQPAPASTSTTTTVGSADGASLPANAEQETNREIFRKLSGQVEGVDYSFNLDRNWAATVDPGIGQFGQSVYNEKELASFLESGSALSESAIKGLQDQMLAKNGLTVSRQNAMNANNYVCVQYLKPNRSNNMAYVLNGSVQWDRGFVDQPGSISCAYTGPETRAAVTAGKKVVLYGFDSGCVNPQEIAVTVNEKPTLERITPHVGTTVAPPPTGTTINYPNPPTEECVKPASPGPGYTWDQENCKWTPPTVEECVQPTSPGPGYTWDEENCKWCPPVQECVQPESPGEDYTWNEEECKWTPPTTEECVQPESPGEGYTWDQENCKWTPPTIDECVQPESPGEGWTWDEENCKWCPPVEECVQPESPGPGYTWDEENCKWTPPAVEECKPNVPVGSPLCDKDPSDDPEQNGNAPDNGTPMPDPGPATDPAVPESEAPDTYTPPAPPAPVVDTPRPPEEIPVNEGAGPETPVEGTVDEGVCEVCGGGMDTETVQAAVVAPAAAASAPAVEDNQAAAQAEANRVAAEQQAAAQAEVNRVAAEQAAAQQAAAEKAAAEAQAQATAQAKAQAAAEQQAIAKAQADAAAKAQAEAQAKAQADAQKAQQQEVATQVAKHTPSKGDSAKGAKTSNNVG